ncbi:ABC transporter permease [Dyadobacter sp. CY107]|uniref:ABC transporter permease n=1 Tax=Dyadobacter fanqingshengii TaxID=2906443 RepID=UPI001F17D00D|nr:ABC transporter permease [Dyadobacter fanqingshengii]MCF2505738.1 ABC transporter permease [Dyadobacter fanqingshengii]
MNKNQQNTNPPPWATKLLRWWADPNTLEETEGDMLEMYAYWQKTAGLTKAKWLYAFTAMKLLRPFAQHKRSQEYSENHFFSHDMIQNYFKIAFRNLVKSKTFSAVNVLGLALGMACSLLIMLWIKDELSVDGFHANKSQLYRIYMREYFSGKVQGVIWTPGPLAEELKKSVPEIEMATPYEWPSDATFSVGDKIYKRQTNAASADFFKMFSFKILQGTPESALKDPNGLAISRDMAITFFGSPEAAMGKPITMDNQKNLMITAVFENIGLNSTLKFDCLRSWEGFLQDNDWAKEWGSTDPLTFFKIRADADPAKVEAKIKHLLDKFNRDEGKPFRTQLAMQPFHEYYLNSTIKDAHMDGGRIEYVRLFALVAVFILLIACINFMNLATARSAKRAKEVGVRKVIGAMRSMLVGQFMGEAILITLFSISIAVLLVAVLLPSFNNLTGKQMSLPLSEPSFWLTLSGLLLTTGLLAGSYPAFFLSSINPIRVLKGTLKFDNKSTWLRQGLVVFQFGLSIIMIVGMITIYRQVEFVQTKNLGYDRENLIYFPMEGDLIKNYDVFRNALMQVNGVTSVSHMTASPGSNGSGTEGISWPGSEANNQVRFTPAGVGYDFAKTMKLEMAVGRDFSKDFATDSMAFLINETALKVIGFKDPIGKKLKWGNQTGVIIGVIKDFHFLSLHEKIRPLIAYMNTKNKTGSAIIRIDGSKTKETLAGIERVCKTVNPKFPFTYAFTDQSYAQQYQSEQIVSKLSDYFAFIAIFISCLGLFGLATFTAEQRTKEIGVRKVLGASISSIVSLLSKDFLKPVAAAIVIASPVAWWLMNAWLQGFAYRIDIAWWMFVLAGVAVVLIAILTVSFQSIKAALLNPVKSLRSE